MSRATRITSVHGAGGRATSSLIADVFLPALGSDALADGDDGVWVTDDIAVTTDAFVVRPATFPGGDIGSLAVHGVVNDLAVVGARARWLTVTFVLEEGTEIDIVARHADALGRAAAAAGAVVVAADTKVVGSGAGDGAYLSTTAVGGPISAWRPKPLAVAPGDAIVVSGPVGDHGVAVMTARDDLGIHSDVVSDSAPVINIVEALLGSDVDVRVMRDVTRGGVATVVNELAERAGVGAELTEADVPVRPATNATCELLGLDPLYVACEGRFVAIVAADQAEAAVAAMDPDGAGGAAVIGHVTDGAVPVVLETVFGGRRSLDRLTGDPLPRIC